MSNLSDETRNIGIETRDGNRPSQEGLRRRAGKMVPRISPDFTPNGTVERRRTLSSSENKEKKPRRNSKDVYLDNNGDGIFGNPTVFIQDPLTANKQNSEICETSFVTNDDVNLHDKSNKFRSPTDYLSPADDISLSSDEEYDEKTTGSFNSRNLYRPVVTEDIDEITEESILLPDGELRRIQEGEREVNIKISTEEKSLSIALQVFFPFLIAGLGTVGAGLLLDVVQVILQ